MTVPQLHFEIEKHRHDIVTTCVLTNHHRSGAIIVYEQHAVAIDIRQATGGGKETS